MSLPHTPTSRSNRSEANIITKSRFFHAIDQRGSKESIKDVCQKENIGHDTGKYWLKQRKRLGTPIASRRIMKPRTGRPKKLRPEILDEMLDPHKNPVRDQQWLCQIEQFKLNCTEQTLRRAFKNRPTQAGRFKKAKIKKVSSKNEKLRKDYGYLHENETVESFWQFVHFTDEAHCDPSQCFSQYVLREIGTRYSPENLQEMPDMQGVKLHVAASLSWFHKGPLQFYHDEHNPPPIKVKKPGKPRRKKAESGAEFDQRMVKWKASLPQDLEVKPKSNSMTQLYYTERLLPVYAKSIEEARSQGRRAILQEDNDPSHGTASTNNLARQFKEAHNIETLVHPPQSPDLNPIEAIWNVLKQRVRRRKWGSISELKQVFLEEWEKISMDEIRSRIEEMPHRCKLLVKTGGKGIKSALW